MDRAIRRHYNELRKRRVMATVPKGRDTSWKALKRFLRDDCAYPRWAGHYHGANDRDWYVDAKTRRLRQQREVARYELATAKDGSGSV